MEHEGRILQIWCIVFAIDNKKCHIYFISYYAYICIYLYIYNFWSMRLMIKKEKKMLNTNNSMTQK